MPAIVAQLLAMFGPILTELLKKWLESLFTSVHKDGMGEVEMIDAARATLPWYSLSLRTHRRRRLLGRMRDELEQNPTALSVADLPFSTRMDLKAMAEAAE